MIERQWMEKSVKLDLLSIILRSACNTAERGRDAWPCMGTSKAVVTRGVALFICTVGQFVATDPV